MIYMWHIFAISPLADGYLCYFHLLVIVHKASMNIAEQVSVEKDVSSFGHTLWNSFAKSYGSLIIVFWDLSDVDLIKILSHSVALHLIVFLLVYKFFFFLTKSHLLFVGLKSWANAVIFRKSFSNLCIWGHCLGLFLQFQGFGFHSELFDQFEINFCAEWQICLQFYSTRGYPIFLARICVCQRCSLLQ